MQNSISKQQDNKRSFLRAFLFFSLIVFFLMGTSHTTHAATAGFVKKGTNTYYRQSNGTYLKNRFLKLNGKYYYFDSKGIMVKGWQYNSKKEKIRYFSKTTGVMYTGYVKSSTGKYQYFSKQTGLLYRGWSIASSGKVRYFEKSNGYMWTGWYKLSNGTYRYFNKNGYMVTGWVNSGNTTRYFYNVKPSAGMGSYGIMLTGLKKINGNYYYFSSSGKLYKNTTKTFNNVKYSIGSNGILTKVITSTTAAATNYTVSNGYVYIKENGKTYTLYHAYASIPGIADGKIDDVTLLAAVADREMGGSTLSGMIGVCLAILNRTLPENTAYPNNFREVLFHAPYQFCEDAYGSYALLEKRLNGIGTTAWHNEKAAREAARQAFIIFKNYTNNKTPRKVSGFKTSDFNYIGFMTPAAFLSAQKNDSYFKPLKYETYANCCTFYDRYTIYGNK